MPRLILIADQFTRPDIAVRVAEAVQAGVQWVHLRDHAATDENFSVAATALSNTLQAIAPDIRISINSRLAIAHNLGLHYHTGKGKPLAIKRGDLKTGYSAHSAEEGVQLAAKGIDYLFYSPVFPTNSKPGHKGVGVENLKAFCKAVGDVPVYALGGITPKNCADCLNAGAQGIVVLSGILTAHSISNAVAAYKIELAPKQSEN